LADRFALSPGKAAMKAVVTKGAGGFEQLVYKDVPRPEPGPGEVLLQVLAAGINNTEINTRVGWYAAEVSGGTNATAATPTARAASGWNAPTPFPLIQGTDCCGRVIVAEDSRLIGRRVLVRACMRVAGFDRPETRWMGSDFDGAFAQYVVVPAREVFPVACDWSGAELGAVPCAYATAETMLHRAGVSAGQHVLIAGASGGVGAAAVQLTKRRGAKVTAMAGRDKHDAVRALGADALLDRNDDPAAALDARSVDVVLDNVGGAGFARMLAVLKRGGRYATSGAIGGPMVSLDLRMLYLNDLTLAGSTAWDEPVFPNLIGYIERGEIRPAIAATFPLQDIAQAQRRFLEKTHVGKIVLIPPPVET
jgi:NADPH:quinone reductase-like Zn-dependent oxidoreductase